MGRKPKNQNIKNNNNNNMNQIFYDEFDITKVKILLCLDDEMLLKYTNHSDYTEEENKKYLSNLRYTLKNLLLNENNKVERTYQKKGCNRIYCKGFGIQYFSNNILHFILPENSCEYDIKNCMPSILLYLYKKHDLPHENLQYYCDKRDFILKTFKIDKKQINKFMNQDNYKIQNIDWLDKLILEVNNNKAQLFSLENDKISKEYQEEKKKSNNFLSSMCCSIVFYYENKILQECISRYKCIVPKYDGFLTDQDINIEDLNKISAEYNIKWDKKYAETPINETTYDEDKLEEILYNDYKIVPGHLNTSMDLANKIYKELSKELVYCEEKWYGYRNKLWTIYKNPNYLIKTFITEHLKLYWKFKVKEKDLILDEEKGEEKWEKIEDAYKKCFKTLDKLSFMSSLIKDLEVLLLDDTFIDKLDKQPYKLVFKNGIYDIKTKTFREIEKHDYISKTMKINYSNNINKENREWILGQLLKICNMNQKHLEYYLSILGFCLLGVPEKQQEIYCLVGQRASNGKTILLEALMNIFDIYLGKCDSKVFESDCNKKHKYLTAFINNTYRIIICNEFDDKKKIDSKLYKEIADGLTLDNEVMFGTTTCKKITGKAFIISNYTLKFDKEDEGMARRYKQQSFYSRFNEPYEIDNEDPENLQFYKDKNFLNKLVDKKYELIDIIIEYAYNYIQKEALPPIPKEFETEQNDVLGMNNEFKTWFSDLDLDINEANMCPAIDLFNKFNDYAIDNGFEKLDKQRNLVDKMKAIHKYKYDRLKMVDGKRGVFIGFSIKDHNKHDKLVT